MEFTTIENLKPGTVFRFIESDGSASKHLFYFENYNRKYDDYSFCDLFSVSSDSFYCKKGTKVTLDLSF